jgi:hypothetical protein
MAASCMAASNYLRLAVLTCKTSSEASQCDATETAGTVSELPQAGLKGETQDGSSNRNAASALSPGPGPRRPPWSWLAPTQSPTRGHGNLTLFACTLA